MWFEEFEKFLKKIGVFYKKEESLAPYTTIKIGGPCSFMVFPEKEEEVIEVLKFLDEAEIKSFLLGGGSNLLVCDDGFEGVVLNLKRFKGIKIMSDEKGFLLKVKAGTLLNQVLSFCLKEGFGGLEFLAGIPATIGGMVKMNAGAFGTTMSDCVRSIKIYRNGKIDTLKAKDDLWSYRMFKEKGTILEIEIKVARKDKEEIKNSILKFISLRKEKQPFINRTFGSVFKNPPQDYAGRLIEACGLKGYRIGDAEISKKHANFIVNLGKAKAKEVLKLIKLAQQAVWKKFNIKLEPEVRFLGCTF